MCSKSFCAQGPDGATEDEAIAAWNTRTHGTLTAEQVREAIEEAKSELLESCEYVGDMYQRQSDVLKAFGKMEQAIADELNTERHVEGGIVKVVG